LDPTDRLNALSTDALISEGERYRLLVGAITDYAIYMLDPHGIVASWNAGAQRFKGYTAAEIIGRHFSMFYTPEDRQAGIPEIALKTAEQEGRFEREGWRVRKDGSRFWANVVIDAIRAPSGELLGYAKITRDLTERRAAEEALRQSEQQFRLLVQSVTDYAIYMLDAEGRVASWNTGAQRIKGYAPAEIIGQHFSRFYTQAERDLGVPLEGLEMARREGRWEREGLRVRKDGTTFWAHVVIDSIRDSRGTVVGFAKITRDITERKQAQADLDKAREALYQSQKMEAVGQLTGGVAHDFNNLLMAALGSLQLLRKRLPADPRLLPLVDNAQQALQRGAALTERMLAFARRQDLKLGPINVANLLRGMQSFLQRSIGPTVRIETSVPAALPAVLSDAIQLETAILNLALNARDAMDGSGAVTVSARAASAAEGPSALKHGDYVVIAVSDTGHGMDPATLARATEPFFTTKGVGKGTGLGLSMVDGLAAQSGGTLQLTSRQGQGTTVEIWLPAAAAANADQPVAEIDKPATGRQFVVLLVDDDELVLMNTASLLDDLGHFVITASSGAEALEALKLRPGVDLVIADYAMPQMNGLDLATAINAAWPKIPIILASGYAGAVRTGVARVRHIRKPFTQEQLRDAATHAVETWRCGEQV